MGRARRAGSRGTGPAALVLAGALLLPGAARAHPHGQLDCAVRLQAGPDGVTGIALTLTLDAGSSAALQPRLQATEDGSAPPAREARQFAELVAGMFRQGGWMLQLRPLDAEGQASGEALPLADPAPARWRRLPDGRLQVAVDLAPEAAPATPTSAGPRTGWRLACLDTSWYWATGFADATQFAAEAPCQATLDAMGRVGDQALALQAAARRAGAAGADAVAPGLLGASTVRAPGGELRCPAP